MFKFPCSLEWTRQSAEDLLTGTCTIEAPSRTTTGTGRTLTFTPASTNVPCRKAPMGATRAQELFVAGVIKSIEAFVFTLKYNQAIANDNRIVFESVTYQVIGITDHGSETITKRVECVKVT
jgi:hypothetical protein